MMVKFFKWQKCNSQQSRNTCHLTLDSCKVNFAFELILSSDEQSLIFYLFEITKNFIYQPIYQECSNLTWFLTFLFGNLKSYCICIQSKFWIDQPHMTKSDSYRYKGCSCRVLVLNQQCFYRQLNLWSAFYPLVQVHQQLHHLHTRHRQKFSYLHTFNKHTINNTFTADWQMWKGSKIFKHVCIGGNAFFKPQSSNMSEIERVTEHLKGQ